jgi:hypothetical protein
MSSKNKKQKTSNGPISGARQGNPYGDLGELKAPMFNDLFKQLFGPEPDGTNVQEDARRVTESVNILLKYAPKMIKTIIGINADGPIREFIEPVGADVQCKNARIAFEAGTTVCWLCGCVIENGEAKACEHIIPALRAVMLKGLITNKVITGKVAEVATDYGNYQKMTANNYLWAHDNCNGSAGKGGMVLIDYDVNTKQFIPDYAQCVLLDSKIRMLPNRNCYYSKGSGIDYTGNGNKVTSPYEAFIAEMNYQCLSINGEFKFFEGNIEIFAKYALNRAKLFFTEAGLAAVLTPEELRQQNALTEADKQNILKKEYDTANELYVLLQNDIELSRQYLESEKELFGRIASQSDQTPPKFAEKLGYYENAIQLYLQFYNLESGDNDSLAESVLGQLNTTSGRELINQVPMQYMLTIICGLTQATIFNSNGGPYKLLKTTGPIDLHP